jgi:hypothetical protein
MRRMEVLLPFQSVLGRLRDSVIVDARALAEWELEKFQTWLKFCVADKLERFARAIVVHQSGFVDVGAAMQDCVVVPPYDSIIADVLVSPGGAKTAGELTFMRKGVPVFRYMGENALACEREGWRVLKEDETDGR